MNAEAFTTEPYFGVCPNCKSRLIKKICKRSREFFIGCANYPYCYFKKTKNKVDYAINYLHVVWDINITDKVIGFVESVCDSYQEIIYLLGAAYFIYNGIQENNSSHKKQLYLEKINFENSSYKSVRIFAPYYFYNPIPPAIAFVPQLKFHNNFHHDFGVFISKDTKGSSSRWKLLCAVEVDKYISHEISDIDDYRDSLVTYPVIRIRGNEIIPKTWFTRVLETWKRMAIKSIPPAPPPP